MPANASGTSANGTPALHIHAACGENREIGIGGRQPWRLPGDLRLFHEATAGRVLVLGRLTFLGWPRAALEGRRPVVVTAQGGFGRPAQGTASAVVTAPGFDEALAVAEALERAAAGGGRPPRRGVCVTGGERVFAAAFACPRPLVLHLTLVHARFEADRFLPEWRHLPWTETARVEAVDGVDGAIRTTRLTLELPAGPR